MVRLIGSKNTRFDTLENLRLHLVVDIVNFEPFVTRVADMDATVNSTFMTRNKMTIIEMH